MMKKGEVIFLGTGASSGIPIATCLTNRSSKCLVCLDATKENSKNRRFAPSILIRSYNEKRKGFSHILIDASKHLHNAALKYFPTYGIDRIDCVLLTHSHFDATGGLDDLRNWTQRHKTKIPVYLSQRDMQSVRGMHSYLVEPEKHAHGGTIAKLSFVPFESSEITLQNVKFEALEVEHGKGFFANAYRFGDVVYMSDVSCIPKKVIERIKGVRLLIIDALRRSVTYGTHLTVEQAMEYISQIRPKQALLTGMCHNLEHEKTKKEVCAEGLKFGVDVGLAYDGLRVEFNLN